MVKKLFTASVLLAALSLPALADSFKRIKSEDDFRAMVVGRTITFDGGSSIINADGSTTGKLNDRGDYYGAWQWSGGYYCRNLVIEGSETGTNCLKMEISGDTLRFTRDRGKGRVAIGTLQ